uniref:Uncharacterized protein n=1 Tax=Anguilla anguilla TaxID=7936 RepID=A0A0E9SIY4_ANGAN
MSESCNPALGSLRQTKHFQKYCTGHYFQLKVCNANEVC